MKISATADSEEQYKVFENKVWVQGNEKHVWFLCAFQCVFEFFFLCFSGGNCLGLSALGHAESLTKESQAKIFPSISKKWVGRWWLALGASPHQPRRRIFHLELLFTKVLNFES